MSFGTQFLHFSEIHFTHSVKIFYNRGNFFKKNMFHFYYLLEYDSKFFEIFPMTSDEASSLSVLCSLKRSCKYQLLNKKSFITYLRI